MRNGIEKLAGISPTDHLREGIGISDGVGSRARGFIA
jgi:hypothetical protein